MELAMEEETLELPLEEDVEIAVPLVVQFAAAAVVGWTWTC
jgi:hypothetical protein